MGVLQSVQGDRAGSAGAARPAGAGGGAGDEDGLPGPREPLGPKKPQLLRSHDVMLDAGSRLLLWFLLKIKDIISFLQLLQSTGLLLLYTSLLDLTKMIRLPLLHQF